MKVRILEELSEELPNRLNFDIGYYEKRSSKCWIVTTGDLNHMYRKFQSTAEIPLWCDGDFDSGQKKKGKRKS